MKEERQAKPTIVGACPICGKVAALVKDHCHDCGRDRGLICNNCNCLLGQAKDDVNVLHGAIKYLQQHAIVGEVKLFPVYGCGPHANGTTSN
jgi:hypothetical protein